MSLSIVPISISTSMPSQGPFLRLEQPFARGYQHLDNDVT